MVEKITAQDEAPKNAILKKLEAIKVREELDTTERKMASGQLLLQFIKKNKKLPIVRKKTRRAYSITSKGRRPTSALIKKLEPYEKQDPEIWYRTSEYAELIATTLLNFRRSSEKNRVKIRDEDRIFNKDGMVLKKVIRMCRTLRIHALKLDRLSYEDKSRGIKFTITADTTNIEEQETQKPIKFTAKGITTSGNSKVLFQDLTKDKIAESKELEANAIEILKNMFAQAEDRLKNEETRKFQAESTQEKDCLEEILRFLIKVLPEIYPEKFTAKKSKKVNATRRATKKRTKRAIKKRGKSHESQKK